MVHFINFPRFFDEKEKFDPSTFRDAIITGLNECESDFDQVERFLDGAGGKLDYRRYAETLFDILFAGGVLAPGGTLQDEGDKSKGSIYTNICVFEAEESHEGLRAFLQIFNKLLRRYLYLKKSLEEETTKVIGFIKNFTEPQRKKLAIITGHLLANGIVTPSVFTSLFTNDILVRDGLSLEFATLMFTSWLKERDISNISSALKKSHQDSKLLELFPFNKRSMEHFEGYFNGVGLEQLVDFERHRQIAVSKKKLQKNLQEQMESGSNVKEMIANTKEDMKSYSLKEHNVVVIIWDTVMGAMEWSKKEDLIAEQSLRHLRPYTPLFEAFSTKGRSELTLIVRVQDFCYDNMNFLKVFHKIVLRFYKADVLSEDTILKWYNEAHSPKGKSVFLQQMKDMVEWLKNAEEESDSEDEEN
ncbi:uncharacterized protein TRIADDRAFT_63688 [Trichoplax adhaerens]|uniref:W2 domain-containing protein n=1 Tax=Trichoplax adhaerens TaxID=10228 RepID=B3RQ61_TRIAD|nr:hypothetical protein TRIADDRAFT_63688 [Trichoplax adhaerens]EDV28297.1 hypothetical protein TRIADDRAFT_63688 [Trichoplax adhaerens]|eukprot:XP_002110131.1 hypothetical protein TRIADDRAFT_63688 [Trichoplax adhaerens]